MKTTYTLSEVMELASVIVHFDEYTGGEGDPVDLQAAQAALKGPGVATIMAELDGLSLLPLRRDNVRYK